MAKRKKRAGRPKGLSGYSVQQLQKEIQRRALTVVKELRKKRNALLNEATHLGKQIAAVVGKTPTVRKARKAIAKSKKVAQVKRAVKTVRRASRKLMEQSRDAILKALKQKPGSGISAVVDATKVKLTRARMLLRQMLTEGVVVKEGDKRYTKYSVK